MSPFDVPGPQFLVFYGFFAGVTLGALWWVCRRKSGPFPDIDLKDPYLFACLNEGPREVIRVAMMGLLDRGLLVMSGRFVNTRPLVHPEPGQPQIEKDLLAHFATPSPLDNGAYFDARAPSAAATAYEDRLGRLGLIPDAAGRRFRHLCIGAAITGLLCFGGLKLLLAWQRGRPNVGLLVFMMFLAVVLAIRIGSSYRTGLGNAYLASIRSLFSGLRSRRESIEPGSGSSELLWLVALFGAAQLSPSRFAFAQYFSPKPSASDGGSAGGGCGGGGGGCGGCGS
jgi:uncharacterized protein (TIGR04222 family)